jgi:hypothetical protein
MVVAGLSVAALAAGAPIAAGDGGAHGTSRVGAGGARYRGRTSQGREISFRVAGGHLTGLRLVLDVVCPSRRVWQVSAAMPAPVKIVDARFRQSFSSHRPGAAGTATVTGRLRHGRVTGTVTMRRYIAPEHRYCSGSATFTVRRRSPRPDTGGRHRAPGAARIAAT